MKADGDVYSLAVKDATEDDSGTYKFKASNPAGEVASDIEVKVTAKPLKPT